jgi:alkylmercury lyase
VERDADGRVTGLGMALNPTPHRVQAGGRRLYAWCAADALGMLPGIGRSVQISSQCPQTGQPVTVTAGPDGVRDIQLPQAVVSAVITGDPDDICGSVCDPGRFFASPDAAAGWAASILTACCSLSPTPSTTPASSCGTSSQGCDHRGRKSAHRTQAKLLPSQDGAEGAGRG